MSNDIVLLLKEKNTMYCGCNRIMRSVIINKISLLYFVHEFETLIIDNMIGDHDGY